MSESSDSGQPTKPRDAEFLLRSGPGDPEVNFDIELLFKSNSNRSEEALPPSIINSLPQPEPETLETPPVKRYKHFNRQESFDRNPGARQQLLKANQDLKERLRAAEDAAK